MKKVLISIYIIFLSLFTMLFKVEAYSTSISGASIDGVNSITTGKTFYTSFRVKFSDLKKASTDTLGIWLVGYELEYDESVFLIEETSNDGNVWDTIIYKEDGKVYVISEFSNDPFKNGCVDGVLYCADYLITIKFYVKDTDVTSSTIKMKQISAGAFPVSGDLNASYLTDDMIELEYPNDVSQLINITKSTNTNAEKKEPESIISNSAPKVETPKAPTSTTTTTTNKEKEKSNNKYLKSLSIENYEIDFSKETKTYNINIKEDVNKLNITAIPEDSNATVEIKGADNLKDNDYKISIKVKAENGEEDTYYITAKIKENNEKTEIKKEEVKEKKETFKLNKKTIIFISIGASLVIIGIIIFAIVNHINNKKLDKELDF